MFRGKILYKFRLLFSFSSKFCLINSHFYWSNLSFTMSKAIFTADQLESLLSRVLTSVMEKFDASFTIMLDKFEARLEKINGDFEARLEKVNGDILAANGRIEKLESVVKPCDHSTSCQYATAAAAATAGSPIVAYGQAVNQLPRATVTTRVGKRQNVNSVKAIKKPLLSCFVSRLDPETTAEDLQEYLDGVGIKDAECWKIKARDGRVFKTAAFKVSCREEFRDLFHDEENWPEGAELRDWVVYRQRDSTA